MSLSIRQNFFAPQNYKFSIERLPHVSYFTQEANIPGLSIQSVESPSPFRAIYRPGDQVSFDNLDITFLVDEDLRNYQEIFNWIVGLTYPDNFDQYANLLEGDGLYSDASLIVQDNSKTSNVEFKFKDIFPTSLGAISLDQKQTSVDYATSTVSFQVNSFTVQKLS